MFGFKPNVQRLKEKSKVKKLIKLLDNHEDKEQRKEVIIALGEIGDKTAARPLVMQIPKSGYSSEISLISHSIGQIKNEEVIPDLIAMLRLRMIPDHEFIRWGAVKALGFLSAEKATLPLTLELVDYGKRLDISKAAHEALVAIGKKAIPSLVQVLTSNGKGLEKYILKGLQPRIAGVLDELEWKPKNETEKLYYLFGCRNWEELAEQGDKAKPILEEMLSIFHKDIQKKYIKKTLSNIELRSDDFDRIMKLLDDSNVEIKKQALNKILESKNPEKRHYLLQHLFNHIRDYGGLFEREHFQYDQNEQYLEDIELYKNMFHDYTECILKLASYKCYVRNHTLQFPNSESIEALSWLCGVNSEISNNVLNLVAKISNPNVIKEVDEFGRAYHGELDLDFLRERAQEELTKRGDPEYKMEITLSAVNWKISK